MEKNETIDTIIKKIDLENRQRFRVQASKEFEEIKCNQINLEEKIQQRIEELEQEHRETFEQRFNVFANEMKEAREEKFRLQALKENEEELNITSFELHQINEDEREENPIDSILLQIRNMQKELIRLEKKVQKLRDIN